MSREATFEVAPKVFLSKEVLFGSEGKGTDYLLLGRMAEKGIGEHVWFDTTKEHVVAIIGKRGSGKSHTLGVLAEGLVSEDPEISRSRNRRAVILLDTLGIYWTSRYAPSADMEQDDIKKQLISLKAWKLSPRGIETEIFLPAGFESPGTPSGTRQFFLKVSDMDPSDWAFLLGLDIFRDPMGQLLSIAHSKVTSEGWVSVDVSGQEIPPQEEYGIDDLTRCIQYDKELTSEKTGFDVRTRRALISKLGAFSKYPLFAKTGTSVVDLLRPMRISVLLLASVPDQIRTVIASVVFRKVLEERKQSSLLKKRKIMHDLKEPVEELPLVWIMIDEAQNIVPAESATISSPSLIRLVREGRNFGVSLAITTQQPSAIDQRVMAQVDTLLSHRLTVGKDLQGVVSNTKTLPMSKVFLGGQSLELDSLIRKLPIGYTVVSNSESPRDFIMQIRPRVSVHGGFEA